MILKLVGKGGYSLLEDLKMVTTVKPLHRSPRHGPRPESRFYNGPEDFVIDLINAAVTVIVAWLTYKSTRCFDLKRKDGSSLKVTGANVKEFADQLKLAESAVVFDTKPNDKPMAKNEKTSKRVLKDASDLLRNSRSKKVRRVAASALAQGADKPKRAKKKTSKRRTSKPRTSKK